MSDENIVNQVVMKNNKSSSNTTKGSKGGKTIEETYTKKTQLEHILLRPDTYIGSIEKHSQMMWVLDPESNHIVNRQIVYVPGLYKIFDEIIVNAADNKQRDPNMNKIEVTINTQENYIKVYNNGAGIPIALHQEHNIYVPELIFGNLLTGSNFDDNEEKTTGGRNGYGSKLANIFSTKFVVETADSTRKLKYQQVFSKNMTQRNDPVITKYTSSDYTCITFYPELKRFKMDSLDRDIVSLLSKRVYDMAGTVLASGSKLSVYLNGSRVNALDFEHYIGLYEGLEPLVAYERVNDRWEIGVGLSEGSFQQVSYVNSISTIKGGTHVTYITDQIASTLVHVINRKNKESEIKINQIKNHLFVYINALITNPSFDSQTKEYLTAKESDFGSICQVTDKFIKKIEKSNIIETIIESAKAKQNKQLKKISGTKKSKLLGISKLDDANYAGTTKSKDCSLILTEGDSAKSLAVAGLSIIGRDYYGVFPLKGKLLNVRDSSHEQILKNEEIQNLVKILGLTFGKVYDDVSSLRYGHVIIMADQDHDGSHIKGLLINFIHHFWPSLLQISSNFLQQFITPIIKCFKNKNVMTFFTIPEYNQWKQAHNDGKGWKIKYYKGLGTSTSTEAKEYFNDLPTHLINFSWDNNANNVIDMAFAKKRVDDRKLWLLSLPSNHSNLYIDYRDKNITYENFINKEFILFSIADNLRSIPHFMDGLKPSQRKVLYACFKRNLKNELKVQQLAGYISEQTSYHHGEMSLTQTIINMAQNFVGSNNINLLSPCGQFGTRLLGGKDSASPRYVFTKLENITRYIYHVHDDPLLDYLDDDGQSIEPAFYVPIIPMVLVNGCEGIGTGWSSTVTTYNPRDIIENLKLMINDQQPKEMHPWYRGYTGEISSNTIDSITTYTLTGTVKLADKNIINITELPIGKWTSDYKKFLETMVIGNSTKDSKKTKNVNLISKFEENHTDTTVHFTFTLHPENLEEYEYNISDIIEIFKLSTTIKTSNMHLFDLSGIIRKFNSPLEIMKAFYEVRLQYYEKRKSYLMLKLYDEWEKFENKVNFIQSVIDGKLVISNRKKEEILYDLQSKEFKLFFEQITSETNIDDNSIDQINSSNETINTLKQLEKGYNYLLSMKIWSFTNEKIEELVYQKNEKLNELNILKSKKHKDLWLDDLNELERQLIEFDKAFEQSFQTIKKKDTKISKSRKSTKFHTTTNNQSITSTDNVENITPPKRKQRQIIDSTEKTIEAQ